MLRFRPQFKVLPPERQNWCGRCLTGHFSHPIRLQSGAGDEVVSGDVAGGTADGHFGPRHPETMHASVEKNLAATLHEDLPQSLRDLLVVEDPRLGDVDRFDSRRVRLEFAQPPTADEFTADAVGLAALVD